MIKKIKYIYATVLILLFNVFAFAQMEGDPDMPTPGEGDGSPASPIDMYIPLLIVLAVLFIVWYVRKRRIQIQ
jgi:hypothetical protein